MTPEEAAIVEREAPGVPTVLMPGAAASREAVPDADVRAGVLFFGGFMGGAGSPNEDAVVRLREQVMPLIWRERPAERLVVVGADPTARVRALAGARVEVVAPSPTRRRGSIALACSWFRWSIPPGSRTSSCRRCTAGCRS